MPPRGRRLDAWAANREHRQREVKQLEGRLCGLVLGGLRRVERRNLPRPLGAIPGPLDTRVKCLAHATDGREARRIAQGITAIRDRIVWLAAAQIARPDYRLYPFRLWRASPRLRTLGDGTQPPTESSPVHGRVSQAARDSGRGAVNIRISRLSGRARSACVRT
jgi:hypothetical protein